MSAGEAAAPLGGYAGRLALVTGAGDGIGAMLARGLASAGMRVLVQDVRAEAAERVAGEIGERARPLVFDVSDRAATEEAGEALRARGEVLSLLWINAGVGVGASVLKARAENVEWAYAVNVLGAIWTARAFRPCLDDASGPRHVGVTASSTSIRAPEGTLTLYAATKHGTLAVAEALRGELAADGIGTTILCPGLVGTRIWDGARARPERFGGARHADPSIAERWRHARSPEAMWPHVEETIARGGGYLVCATDAGETRRGLEERARAIGAAFREI